MESSHYRDGVGLMLVNKEKKVWVGERLNMKGAWQMPQGGIDPNESASDTVARELLEETGIDFKDVSVLAESEQWLSFLWPEDLQKSLWEGYYIGQRLKWFLLQLNSGTDTTNLMGVHPEFSDYKWADVGELFSMIVDFKKEMYHSVIQEFSWFFHD